MGGEVQNPGRVELREVGLGGGETAEDLRGNAVARGLGLEKRGLAFRAGQRRKRVVVAGGDARVAGRAAGQMGVVGIGENNEAPGARKRRRVL